MGTWGSGNFEDDTAMDHLSGVVGRLVSEVEEAMSGDPVRIEPDEYWGVAVPCDVELLHVLARAGYGAGMLPEAGVVERWKADYLGVWDRAIDGLGPSPAYRAARRATLVRTFDALIADARGGPEMSA